MLNLKILRTKLFTRENANLEVIRAKNEEFKAALNKKFEALGQIKGLRFRRNKQNHNGSILETAIEVGAKTTKQVTSKFSQSTKDLIKKRQQMKVTSSKDRMNSQKYKIDQ